MFSIYRNDHDILGDDGEGDDSTLLLSHRQQKIVCKHSMAISFPNLQQSNYRFDQLLRIVCFTGFQHGALLFNDYFLCNIILPSLVSKLYCFLPFPTLSRTSLYNETCAASTVFLKGSASYHNCKYAIHMEKCSDNLLAPMQSRFFLTQPCDYVRTQLLIARLLEIPSHFFRLERVVDWYSKEENEWMNLIRFRPQTFSVNA